MPDRPTVYLVDDQAIVRAAFKSWLVESGRFDVVGQGGEARAAILDVGRMHPDLVLLDVALPGINGLDALPMILDANPRGRVVIVTDFENASFVQTALERGAKGYLSKADEPADLLAGLLRVVAGETVVSPTVARPPPS